MPLIIDTYMYVYPLLNDMPDNYYNTLSLYIQSN